jgi:hypothetical protein
MSKPSHVIVLAEDQRQQQFIYRYLKIAGVRPDQIRSHISPSGRGSAEQWVRKYFPDQAKKCRARNTRADTSMFVMLDADTKTVQERLEVLDDALKNAGQSPIDKNRDPIARLIPRRNVETWILVLSLEPTLPPVEEESDYKPKKSAEEWTSLVPAAAKKLLAWSRPSAAPANLIDSLWLGICEIPRALP